MWAKIIQNMVDKGELLAEAVRRILVLYDRSPHTFKYFILSNSSYFRISSLDVSYTVSDSLPTFA